MTELPTGISPCPSCGSTEVVAGAICMNCGQYRPELEERTQPVDDGLPTTNPLRRAEGSDSMPHKDSDDPAPSEPAGSKSAASESEGSESAAASHADSELTDAHTDPTEDEPGPDAPAADGEPHPRRLADDEAVVPDAPVDPEPAPRRITAADLAEPNQVDEVPADEEFLPNCLQCGGAIDSGYCEQCGSPATKVRDHFTEAPAAWVAGMCDRGIRHSRNEDAMALAAEGDRAVLVVCDGVSTSDDSDVASLAAARAALERLSDRETDAETALAEAVRVANEAVVASTDPESRNAASCTFVAAVVESDRYTVANIGDSRAYWISDHGNSVQLSVDDSVAQLRIDSGIDREIAENGPGAHAITKWLGKDASDLNPTTSVHPITESGWLLVCSDGLWNYASEPEQLKALFDAALADNSMQTPEPAHLAAQLTAWANEQGGKDNITVTLARLEPVGKSAPDADILAAEAQHAATPDAAPTPDGPATAASTTSTTTGADPTE